MEQLWRLKARITSLEELRELMRAMRALAASHVQEAQSALDGIRRYVDIIEDSIAEGVSLLTDGPVAADPAGNDVSDVVVLISSEHGFVGGLNERLIDRALAVLADRQLAVVGRRGADLLTERGVEPGWIQPMATQVGGMLGVARRVADRLTAADRVTLVFAAYRRGGNYEIQERRVLPLAPELVGRADGSAPLHHLSAASLLEQLAREYLLAEIASALMESFASENGARLHVMENADRNIERKLERLTVVARNARQESITAELLEVITGAESILSEG